MTTYIWKGISGAPWSNDDDWANASDDESPAGPPGSGDTVWVPARNNTYDATEQENFIIDTSGQSVGDLYGASIGLFPVYDPQGQFEYTGEVDSFTTLQGGLSAEDLYGVVLDGGDYTVSGNAGSTDPNNALGFQNFSDEFMVGTVGPDSNAWLFGESEVELESGTLTVVGSFAGVVDDGVASCDEFLGGVVNDGTVTADSAVAPIVNGGSLTINGPLTDGAYVTGGTLTTNSASGIIGVGEVGGGSFTDFGSLTLPEGWTGDVENSGVAIFDGAADLVSATFTVGVDPGGGTLEFDDGLKVSGVVNNGSVYSSGLQDGDPFGPGLGGSVTVVGATTVDLNADDPGSGIVIDGPQATATFDGDVTIGDDASGNFEVDEGKAQITGLLTAGDDATGYGTVIVDGVTSTLLVDDGGLLAGDDGAGYVTIGDGGELDVAGLTAALGIAAGDNSTGGVVVTGPISSLSTTGAIDVGYGGLGSLAVDDSASLKSSFTGGPSVEIGVGSKADGTMAIADSGTKVTLDDGLGVIVGVAGHGLLQIDDGATLTVATIDPTQSYAVTLGDDATGDGQLSVAGTGSELTAESGALIAGNLGHGAVIVSKGGVLQADDGLDVAFGDDSIGAITVTGKDSLLATTGPFVIGDGGAGYLAVDDGASLVVGDTIEAFDDDASAVTTISGGDTTATYLGDDVIGSGGIADDTIDDAAAVTVDGDLTLGGDTKGDGTISVDGADSSLTFGATLIVGGSGKGTLEISNGALVASDAGGAGTIEIGARQGSNGSVSIEGKGSELQGDALIIGGTATAAGGAGSLTAETGGIVDVQSVLMWNGMVSVDNESLLSIGEEAPMAGSGVDVQSDADLVGSGLIIGSIENDGEISASGGLLQLDDDVSGDGSELIDADATLAFSASVASGQTVSFAVGGGSNWGTLDLSSEGTGLTFAAPISGFAGYGGAASVSDVIEIAGSGGTDHVAWTQDTASQGTLQVEDAGDSVLETLTLDGSYNQNQFVLTDPGDVDQITYTAPCYARGTRILTDRGEVAAEALRVGDNVVTASGVLRPIVWIGHRRVDISRHPDPAAVWPVRVSAGAFGEGLPRRDLWLSPGHNIASEGALMPISCLINGRSVAQIEQDSVEYWHVELRAHDVLLAEGLPAESYFDCGNRTAFANGGAFVEAHPDFQPRRAADTCLPVVDAGPAVTTTKARLLARLAAQGYCVTSDADAHLLVDGTRVEPIRLLEMRLGFVLPASGRDIALRSEVFIPARTIAESADRRALGLCVARLQIDGSAPPLDDDEMCASGWHEAESADGRFSFRWTTGATPLPPGARIVVLDLAGVGYYGREWAHNADSRFA